MVRVHIGEQCSDFFNVWQSPASCGINFKVAEEFILSKVEGNPIGEQSTSKQSDQNITNIILANTGTMICFRTASPVDERLVLSQFAPYLEPGEIGNLPRFRLYQKLSAVEPEKPFLGEILPILVEEDWDQLDTVMVFLSQEFC